MPTEKHITFILAGSNKILIKFRYLQNKNVITMIHLAIFHHILHTIKDIPVCPILVLPGDEAQQQHIKTVNGHIKAVSSIIYDAMFKKFTLKQQHRCVDKCYENFLNQINKPKHCLLDEIRKNNVICQQWMPTTEDIMETFLKHPNAMFVTVPCDATKYIIAIIQHLKSDQQPIATVPYQFVKGKGFFWKLEPDL